jgi:23S rRNA pseudouridine1911/1915/1917 synthase
MRLDQAVCKLLSFSRTCAQGIISGGGVLVNGKFEKKHYCVAAADRIAISLQEPREPSKLQATRMAFDVLFEDEYVFVVNKPAGLVVHPAPGNYEGTFVNGFLAHCADSDLDDPVRPGVVHRLDKDTSGVLIAAKTQKAVKELSLQFHDRVVYKEYLAILTGILAEPVVAEGCIGRDPRYRQRMAVLANGRSARTEFFPISSNAERTLVRAVPLTGRTHQIRVHAAYLGRPILGDAVYGKNCREQKVTRQMLHCSCILCVHPVTHRTLTLKAPLPIDMLTVVQELGLSCSI